MEDMTPQLYEKLGGMSAHIDGLQKDVADIKITQREMQGTLATLLERSAKQAGGRGALLTVGGGSATVGALLVTIAQWLGFTPAPPPQNDPPIAAHPLVPALPDR